MSRKKTVKKTTSATKSRRKTEKKTKKAPKPKTAAQEALEVTWVLKGHLKNAQIAYIRVGKLLAQVRDRKLYAALHHPDIESYAEQRLNLGRASLYRYLQVYDWICKYHKEWLEPKPKGFIPDLSDAADLIWIESELARTDLTSARRAILEEFRKKGLDGKLRRTEVRKVRRSQNTVKGGLKQVISKLRQVRKHAAELANMSPEVLAHLDAAIRIMVNDNALKVAGLDAWQGDVTAKWRQNLVA